MDLGPLTQRISSGLYAALHVNVSSSIFFDLSTFQFRASRYLLRHASVQYWRLRPEMGPMAALNSLTCFKEGSIEPPIENGSFATSLCKSSGATGQQYYMPEEASFYGAWRNRRWRKNMRKRENKTFTEYEATESRAIMLLRCIKMMIRFADARSSDHNWTGQC